MLYPTKNPRTFTEAAPWRWAVVGGILGLLLAVVLLAPAGWLAAALHQATLGRVQLVETVGTVWTGSGRLLLTGGSGSRDSAALSGRVKWKLRPAGLALGLDLSADCCTPRPLQVRAEPRWSGVSVQIFDNTSEWPTNLLSGLGAPWNTVRADGNLQLMTQGLTLEWLKGQVAVSGRAELTAVGLTSSLTTLKPMGSYRISLTGGNTIELKLTTLQGGLQLSGSGRWVGSRLQFEGVASAAPNDEAALSNLLNIIGRRNGPRSIITLG